VAAGPYSDGPEQVDGEVVAQVLHREFLHDALVPVPEVRDQCVDGPAFGLDIDESADHLAVVGGV
jgi:hypothetical protein